MSNRYLLVSSVKLYLFIYLYEIYLNYSNQTDVSIWMYQIIKGVRESELSATTNKHLIVMFHRICKLLFFGIKPIFVFDGGVPELKKKTIVSIKFHKLQLYIYILLYTLFKLRFSKFLTIILFVINHIKISFLITRTISTYICIYNIFRRRMF